MRDIPSLDAAGLRENHLTYRARTRRGTWLIALAVAGLTWLGAGWGLPFAGLAALLLTFGGALWWARRRLLLAQAHHRQAPVAGRQRLRRG